MTWRLRRHLRHYHQHFPRLALARPLWGYALVVSLVGLADSIMAYVAPVFIEDFLGNPLLMGIVLASSSFVGFWADFLIGKLFGGKKYYFFLLWTIFIGFFFPITLFLFPPIVPVFLLSMASWGIYFELLEFSHFHYIHEFHTLDEHPHAWGVIYTAKSMTYSLGPLLASLFIGYHLKFPLVVAFLFFLVSLLGAVFFHRTLGKGHVARPVVERRKVTFRQEFSVWRVLFRRIWPVWLFTLVIFIVDATFWTVGALLSEELANSHAGGFLMTAYMLPAVFSGFFVKWVADRLGKKRAAFIGGILSGCFLFAAGLVGSVWMLLLFVFLAAFFSSLAIPEILAASEDYMERLKQFGNDMVGLERSAFSLGYVVGPILGGWLATLVGYHLTFSVMGVLLAFVSLILMVVTPRRVLMPQKELREL